jgi:hypothetical protein
LAESAVIARTVRKMSAGSLPVSELGLADMARLPHMTTKGLIL